MSYMILAGLGASDVASLESRLQVLRNQLMLAKNTVSTVKNTPVTWSYQQLQGSVRSKKVVTKHTTRTYQQVVSAGPARPGSVSFIGAPGSHLLNENQAHPTIYNQAKAAIANAQSAVTAIQKQITEVEDQLVAAKKQAAETEAQRAAEKRAAELTLPPLEVPKPKKVPTPKPDPAPMTEMQRILQEQQANQTLRPPENRALLYQQHLAKQRAEEAAQQQAPPRPAGPQPTKAPMSTGKKVAIGGAVGAAALVLMTLMD